MKHYYVYIMASISKRLYTGVTNNLIRRANEHRNRQGSGFTRKYRIFKLVYYETYPEIHSAIRREKQIKGWSREKKTAMIESANPTWKDLGVEWYAEKDSSPEFTPSIAEGALNDNDEVWSEQ